MINIQEKKNKIINFLGTNGPSLPVQVARTIEMDPVFASAILSELLDTKQIKTSYMKVGSSPLYLLPTQDKLLEKNTEHLKPIEKEAQEKLKDEKIIIDENCEPATRVALRNIKDFAIPFKFQEKIMWKYAFTPQEEINKILLSKNKTILDKEEKTPNLPTTKQEDTSTQEETSKEESKSSTEQNEEEIPKAWEAKKEEIKQAKEKSKKIENIFEEKKRLSEKPKTFLEEIENYLKEINTTITTIEEVDKKRVTAIIKSNNIQSMLFAFNKARITETELLKCYKEADKKNLPYQIITKADLAKKLLETIRAYQRLIKVSKL